MRLNRQRSVLKTSTEIARLPGWEFAADKSQYGGYITRHWNWMNSYWMFWTGCLRGASLCEQFLRFSKNHLLSFHRIFSSSGPGPMSLCHGVASVVRPSTVFKMLLLRHFWFWLFHKIGLGGGFKLLHRIVKLIIYGNLCKCTRNHKKYFFSFISRPILIWFALSGRAKFGTLNFYTEFWDFSPLINYGNLCKFIPKITKIASSPSFLDRFSFCLFYLIGLGGGFKTCTQNFRNWLIMLIYANVFKITTKKNHQTCFFSFISQPILIWFALSGRAKFGTLNFYTELWDFAPLINYGNLYKFIPKIKKIASSPSFLYRFSFCLFYLIGLGGGFKTCTNFFEIH